MAKRARKKRIEEKLGTKLLGYSIAAGAVLAMGTNADAMLMKNKFNVMVDEKNPLMFDLDGDGMYDFEVNVLTNQGFEILIQGLNVDGLGLVAPNSEISRLIAVQPLDSNRIIPFVSSSSIGNASPAAWATFAFASVTGSSVNIGLALEHTAPIQPLNANGKTLTVEHFGYLQLDMVAPDHSYLVTGGTAVQTIAGMPAHVERIPEPGTLALLATGAAGLLAQRRWKKRKESETERQS